MKTIKTEVFNYDELADEAKEKARDWFRSCSDGDSFWSEFTIDDAQTIAGLMGIEFDKPRHRNSGVAVYWSGFSSQGDGACFEGSWSADRLKPGAVAEHAPQDKELHRIAGELERIAKAFPESSFRVRHSGHYHHSGCTSFECEVGDIDSADSRLEKYMSPDDSLDDAITMARDRWADDFPEQELIQLARDFMDWIYGQLEKQYEYENSDDTVAENIRINEYTFTADGKRFG